MAEAIRLKKNNILKFEIEDEEGKLTGQTITFDMEDVELPLRYQECLEQHKKNITYLKNQYVIIEKREDVKGKKLLTKNEEDKLTALNEFYKREMAAVDLFLGEGGCNKLLNGRKPYYSMFDDIGEVIAQVMPEIEKNIKNVEQLIKSKYHKGLEENNVLE